MNEIITIASSTWKNVLRMKVVYFLIFCALVLVGSAYNYDVLSMGLQKELMIDVSLVLNSIAAMLVVISLTFEIPKELREGVASTLLSKPLGRFQYLFGKMIGCIVICALIAVGSFVIFNVAFGDRISVSMLQTQLLVILAMIPMSAIGVLSPRSFPKFSLPSSRSWWSGLRSPHGFSRASGDFTAGSSPISTSSTSARMRSIRSRSRGCTSCS